MNQAKETNQSFRGFEPHEQRQLKFIRTFLLSNRRLKKPEENGFIKEAMRRSGYKKYGKSKLLFWESDWDINEWNNFYINLDHALKDFYSVKKKFYCRLLRNKIIPYSKFHTNSRVVQSLMDRQEFSENWDLFALKTIYTIIEFIDGSIETSKEDFFASLRCLFSISTYYDIPWTFKIGKEDSWTDNKIISFLYDLDTFIENIGPKLKSVPD